MAVLNMLISCLAICCFFGSAIHPTIGILLGSIVFGLSLKELYSHGE